MQLSKFLFISSITLMMGSSHLVAQMQSKETKLKLSTPVIDEMIREEAKQVQLGLRAIEMNKELKENHFTPPQLKLVTDLAKKFIHCAKSSRRASTCAKLRNQMDLVNREGRLMTDIQGDNDFKLNGPGAIISSLGDSLETILDKNLLTKEYGEILKSISKYGSRGLPTVSQFSKLSAGEMQKVLNSRIYPHVARIISGFTTADSTPTSEDRWNRQTKCEDAIGYRKIDNRTTDQAMRCEFDDLDPNGIIRNKEYALKYFTPCVKDQAHRGTCTAFATIGALEIRLLKNKKKEYNLSEQFTYFYNEIYGGWWGRYQYGVNTMSALKKVKKKGAIIPLEKYWVYNPSFNKDPFDSSTNSHPNSCPNYNGQKCTDYAFQSGESRSGLSYTYTVPSRPKPHVKINSRHSFWNVLNASGSLDTAINYLKNGDPIIVSFTVKSNFKKKGGGDNYVKYAKKSGGGGHASVLVGFVKNEDLPSGAEKATEKGFFILRNSWGGDWADCGHIYVDYKYFKKYAYGLARITYNYQN